MDPHEQNRRSWNLATRRHNDHKVGQAAFLASGGSTLFPEEIGLLGDLRGKRLVHLQCNSGQDTLSLAALGADAVGVDISDEAIAFAKQLSRESGIPADFVRADVFDWLQDADAESFDIAFFSYGALCWLSDLERWARGVARILGPGGRLVGIEFHPMGAGFEGTTWRYPYLSEGPQLGEGIGDYVGLAKGALSPSGHRELEDSWENPEDAIEWVWSLSQTVMAVVGAGLRLTHFEEYPYTNGCDLLGGQVALDGRRYGPPPGLEGIPLMFSVVAERPARV